MNFPKKVIESVASDFSKKRSDRDALRLRRLKEIYSLCPEIKDIDASLSRVSKEIAEATFTYKSNIRERIESIKNNNLALQERRASLLCNLGFDRDYTDPPYECEICNDTGYDGFHLCACHRRALVDKMLDCTGFGNLIKAQSFESFDPSVFETEEQRKRASAIRTVLEAYADEFTHSSDSLLLVGGTGLGKTHLSSSIARRVIEKGYNVVYESAESIFREIGREIFRSDFSEKDPEYYRFFDCDLLIIDDLGSEMITPSSVSYLYNIINTRLNKGLPMIISTNNSSEELLRKYDERIASRLFGEFVIHLFMGNDQRRKKLGKK
ncbi:MAG: ATP-binding protein [Clostridia bacterium]|nr:ATP-binding protein [Clostridia bacterium]